MNLYRNFNIYNTYIYIYIYIYYIYIEIFVDDLQAYMQFFDFELTKRCYYCCYFNLIKFGTTQ